MQLNATITLPVELAMPAIDETPTTCELGTLRLDVVNGSIDEEQLREGLGQLLCETGGYLLAGATITELPMPTAPAERPRVPILVCAQTTHQARIWARRHGIPHQQVIVADSWDKVRGLAAFTVATLPGFHTRPDAEKITQVISAQQAAQ